MSIDPAQIVNDAAVRVLFEGLNGRGEFRRVLYFPYMDGYVSLLVTDANGNVVWQITPQEISKQYLPEEYWDDVTSEWTFGHPDSEDR